MEVGDYITEKTSGRHNIGLAKLIAIMNSNECVIEVIISHGIFKRGERVTFGYDYITDCYRKARKDDIELLALVI